MSSKSKPERSHHKFKGEFTAREHLDPTVTNTRALRPGPEQQDLASKSLFTPWCKSRAECSPWPLTSSAIFHQPGSHLAPVARGPPGSTGTHTSPCQRSASSDAAAAHLTLSFRSSSRQTQQGRAAPCPRCTCPPTAEVNAPIARDTNAQSPRAEEPSTKENISQSQNSFTAMLSTGRWSRRTGGLLTLTHLTQKQQQENQKKKAVVVSQFLCSPRGHFGEESRERRQGETMAGGRPQLG